MCQIFIGSVHDLLYVIVIFKLFPAQPGFEEEDDDKEKKDDPEGDDDGGPLDGDLPSQEDHQASLRAQDQGVSSSSEMLRQKNNE